MAVTLSPADKIAYDRDGYLVVRQLFTPQEAQLLLDLSTDESITSKGFDLVDQEGKKTRLTLWFTPGDDSFGLMSRSQKMVAAVRQLLGSEGEVCHFHSKVMQKEPRTGGAWEWHQDYGYWYKNGFLYPDAMLSVMVALTESTVENGCLQVLRGSHKMQRFEHVFIGEQQGADPDFVQHAEERCELVYAQLQPGDVLFFHSNTLHRSDANNSDRPRWSIISAYNLDFNVPFREKNPSCITPIEVVPDEAILASGGVLPDARDFLLKENEITLNVS
jgi:Phytanoyl-CoA dioxygenase (PhyH)